MTITRVPFSAVPQLSKTDHDYAVNPEIFADLIEHLPSLDGLINSYNIRSGAFGDRSTLISVLKDQYDRNGLSHPKELDALGETDHCTIVTAHQPSLLTGPLYFIYKICSAINLARQCNARLGKNVIHPVFLLGGEDHDFEEMNHLSLFGRSLTWETDQTGSVGRMTQDGISQVLDELYPILGDRETSERLKTLIAECFDGNCRYGDAMHRFVCKLFADTELIVIQTDDERLKAQFKPVIRDEVFNQTSHDLIEEAQRQVEQLGYKAQAHVREINLFYMHDGLRNRIERSDDGFAVVDTDIRLNDEEMDQLIKEHPERFSPNVNLRPLYQETVLPNIAYVGGGGELAYWLERKSQFEHYNVPFPVLIRRNSVLFINRGNSKLRRNLNIEYSQLFDNPDHEISEWIRENAEHEVDITDELQHIETALSGIVEKAQAIEPTFARKVEAFQVKMLKEVDHMGKRLVREEKARNEQSVGKIRKLYEKLFPSGSLQERKDNFIPMYLTAGDAFKEVLLANLDPLTPGFIIIEEA